MIEFIQVTFLPPKFYFPPFGAWKHYEWLTDAWWPRLHFLNWPDPCTNKGGRGQRSRTWILQLWPREWFNRGSCMPWRGGARPFTLKMILYQLQPLLQYGESISIHRLSFSAFHLSFFLFIQTFLTSFLSRSLSSLIPHQFFFLPFHHLVCLSFAFYWDIFSIFAIPSS